MEAKKALMILLLICFAVVIIFLSNAQPDYEMPRCVRPTKVAERSAMSVKNTRDAAGFASSILSSIYNFKGVVPTSTSYNPLQSTYTYILLKKPSNREFCRIKDDTIYPENCIPFGIEIKLRNGKAVANALLIEDCEK